MSQCLCLCGRTTHADDEPRDASGVLYPVADLQAAEDRITQLLASFFRSADCRAWVRANFEFPYPEDASDSEVIRDILSRELDARFTSVFRCPHCGRLATNGSEEAEWRFFEPAPPTG